MSVSKLEKEVNDFIAQPDIKVLELQYSAIYNGGYSVMIVYEEENSIKPSQYRIVT